MMFKRNRIQHELLTGERGYERFEATVIAARSAGDMADGEAALLAECKLNGWSCELVGASDVGRVRIYRVERRAASN